MIANFVYHWLRKMNFIIVQSGCISIEFHPYYEALSTGKKVNHTMDDNSDAETNID